MNALSDAFTKLAIGAVNASARLSPKRRQQLACVLAFFLWWAIPKRRRVVNINLARCFPEHTVVQRRAIARSLTRNFVRAALDHGVLWRASRADIEKFIEVRGAEHLLDNAHQPLILIAPHFVGLDAGGVRFNTLVRGASIYSRASNPLWNEALLAGRLRFSAPLLIAKAGFDLRAMVRAIRDAMPFYYLPDTDVGPQHCVFVPFFGIATATLPMVPRLARLCGAKVIMAVTEMTPEGYIFHLEPPWQDFPSASIEDDTARMNREIERWVRRLPDQYLWMHRRFKSRPAGEASFY